MATDDKPAPPQREAVPSGPVVVPAPTNVPPPTSDKGGIIWRVAILQKLRSLFATERARAPTAKAD
jgi:hypothetical protein